MLHKNSNTFKGEPIIFKVTQSEIMANKITYHYYFAECHIKQLPIACLNYEYK